MRKVTLEDWQAEGRAKFGDDPKDWKFVCPSCGQVQSLRDFDSLGMPPRQSQNIIAFSCVGRWNRKPGAHIVHMGEPTHGHGCNYAGGGLFQINPVEVVIDAEKNETRATFEWADE